MSEEYFINNGIHDIRASENLVTIRGPQSRPPKGSRKQPGKPFNVDVRNNKQRSPSADYKRFSVPTPSPDSVAVGGGISLVGQQPPLTNGDTFNGGMPPPSVATNEVVVDGPPSVGSDLKVRAHTTGGVHVQETANGHVATAQTNPPKPVPPQRSVHLQDPLDSLPKPRLCRLLKASPRDSYGFLLRTYNDNQEKVSCSDVSLVSYIYFAQSV